MDRRMYAPETRRSNGIRQQGRLIDALGTVVSVSDTRIYCVDTDHASPWITKEEFIDRIIGHPIRIGDVLEKMGAYTDYYQPLTDVWEPSGFTKSLQEILDQAEWRTRILPEDENPFPPYAVVEKVMKDPAASLFAYLIQLFHHE